MVFLVIVLLGTLSLLVGSDGNIDTDVITPTVPQQEFPTDDMSLTPTVENVGDQKGLTGD